MPEACDLALLALPEASELRRLCTRCPDIEALRFREGECFIREGEEDRDVYLVLDGAFVVEKAPAEPGGRPAMLAGVSCEPGAPVFVGEMAYLGTGLRSASVRRSGSSHALRLRGEQRGARSVGHRHRRRGRQLEDQRQVRLLRDRPRCEGHAGIDPDRCRQHYRDHPAPRAHLSDSQATLLESVLL